MKNKPNDPWALMDAMLAKQAEPTGPEWFSTPEYANRYNLSLRTATPRLDALVESGVLEKWSGVGTGPRGHKRTINKYRFTK